MHLQSTAFSAPNRHLRVYKYVSFTRKWLYIYWDHIYNYWNESYVEGYKVCLFWSIQRSCAHFITCGDTFCYIIYSYIHLNFIYNNVF